MQEVNKAKAAAATVEAEVKAVEEAILNIGGVKLRAQKAKVEGLTQQIATLQTNLTKANVELKTAQRAVDKLAKKIEKDEEERTANLEYIEKIKEEFKAVEAGAMQVGEEYMLYFYFEKR